MPGLHTDQQQHATPGVISVPCHSALGCSTTAAIQCSACCKRTCVRAFDHHGAQHILILMLLKAAHECAAHVPSRLILLLSKAAGGLVGWVAARMPAGICRCPRTIPCRDTPSHLDIKSVFIDVPDCASKRHRSKLLYRYLCACYHGRWCCCCWSDTNCPFGAAAAGPCPALAVSELRTHCSCHLERCMRKRRCKGRRAKRGDVVELQPVQQAIRCKARYGFQRMPESE